MCLAVIESPQSQSVCEGGTVEFSCVIMFPNGTMPVAAAWFTNSGSTDGLRGHARTDDLNGRSAPAIVTNILTVSNVNISINGVFYHCVVAVDNDFVGSNRSILTVLGKYTYGIYISECFTAWSSLLVPSTSGGLEHLKYQCFAVLAASN